MDVPEGWVAPPCPRCGREWADGIVFQTAYFRGELQIVCPDCAQELRDAERAPK